MEATQHINNLYMGRWREGKSPNSIIGATRTQGGTRFIQPKVLKRSRKSLEVKGLETAQAKEKRKVNKEAQEEILNQSTTAPSTFQDSYKNIDLLRRKYMITMEIKVVPQTIGRKTTVYTKP